MEVYRLIREITGHSPLDGATRPQIDRLMSKLGASWRPLMQIGTGCTHHLRAGEVPMKGRIVCNLSKHVTAVIDGVINDTYDPSRNGMRCVYGYWRFPDVKEGGAV